jgi:hypothetical protein
LDENKYIAAILKDLSKAFDCLPHDLILLKLEAYGLSEKSINLLNSYLSGRKQCALNCLQTNPAFFDCHSLILK